MTTIDSADVYIVLYNADTTEGRGPMICRDIGFTSEDEAFAHIGANEIDPYGMSKNITNPSPKGRDMCKQGWYAVKRISVYKSKEDAAQETGLRKAQKILDNMKKEDRELLLRHLSVLK